MSCIYIFPPPHRPRSLALLSTFTNSLDLKTSSSDRSIHNTNTTISDLHLQEGTRLTLTTHTYTPLALASRPPDHLGTISHDHNPQDLLARFEPMSTTETTIAPSPFTPTTADQLHERYYHPKNYSSFDTDVDTRTRLDINLDPTGHAYLPFHPTSFGFEFPPPSSNSSFPFSLGSSATRRLVLGMMQNPIDINVNVNNTINNNNSPGEAMSTTLPTPTAKQDWVYTQTQTHTRTHITVNPSDLSSFSEIDQNRRRESGESGTSTVVSRVLDVGDDDEEDEEDELRSPSSSRSGSPEVVIQTKVQVVPKTERTLGSRSRSISASASASGFRTRSPEGEREGEREYSPVPPRRATRRRSSVKSSVGSDDDEDADQDGKRNASGKKGKNGNRNKKIKVRLS